MLPDGETITALQEDLYDRLADYRAPTTAEVDRFHDRLARYRADGRDNVKRPRIELERLDGETLPYALRSGDDTSQSSGVQSDVDFDQAPIFTSGAQVAQIAPPVNPAHWRCRYRWRRAAPIRCDTGGSQSRAADRQMVRRKGQPAGTAVADCIRGSPTANRLRRHRRRWIQKPRQQAKRRP
jgi:hypothetical protein